MSALVASARKSRAPSRSRAVGISNSVKSTRPTRKLRSASVTFSSSENASRCITIASSGALGVAVSDTPSRAPPSASTISAALAPGAKPSCRISSRYLPGGRSSIENSPSAPLVPTPWLGPRATTPTPAMPVPSASVTRPEIRAGFVMRAVTGEVSPRRTERFCAWKASRPSDSAVTDQVPAGRSWKRATPPASANIGAGGAR